MSRKAFTPTSRLMLAIAVYFASAKGLTADTVSEAPHEERRPVLRLEAHGVLGDVHALAFSPEGQRLFVAGRDKTVRIFDYEQSGEGSGRFRFNEDITYRIPIGPGLSGVVNAVSISPDGRYLAVAGLGVMDRSADFQEEGVVLSTALLSADDRRQLGTIYVFDLTHGGVARRLIGNLGPVLSLAFAGGKTTTLVSVAEEPDAESEGTQATLRSWSWNETMASNSISQVSWSPQLTNWDPNLAVWRTRDGKLQSAVATGGQTLQVWNGASGGGLRNIVPDDGQPNALNKTRIPAVAYIPGVERLIAASWQSPPNGAQQLRLSWMTPQPETAIRFDRDFPLAVAPCTASGGRRQTLIATVTYVGGTYDLQIWDVDQQAQSPSLVRKRLWSANDSGGSLPPLKLAASSQGGFLAVAGHPSGRVAIFRVIQVGPGLTVEELPPLPVHGLDLDRVDFVRNQANALGIKVTHAAVDERGARRIESFIFDPAKGVTDDVRQAWREVAPDQAGLWTVGVRQGTAGQPDRLTVKGPGRQPSTDVLLDGTHQAHALRPPHEPHNVPILAVAQTEEGQPKLQLYALRMPGMPVLLREFTGHSAPIRTLAFTDAESLLLMSAGVDRLVCVWSLEDLNQLASVGRVPGLVVREAVGRDGTSAILVEEVGASRQLQVGDRIDGQLSGEQFRPFSTALDFELAVAQAGQGDTLPLRISRQGQTVDVVLAITGRGTDERKPLFSVFFSRHANDREPTWIGWHPSGEFEARDRGAQELIGWHVNPARPEDEVAFAPVAEYREQFLRPGLLKELINRRQWSPRPATQPTISLWLQMQDAGGTLVSLSDVTPPLLRTPPEYLWLQVTDVPDDAVESVAWKLGDGDWRETSGERIGPDTWIAKLDAAETWSRRSYIIQTAVRMKDPRSSSQPFLSSARFDYRPPPPAISLVTPQEGLPTHVHTPRLPVTVRVEPGIDGEQVHLDITVNEQPVLARAELQAPQDFTLDLELEQGENQVRFIATNSEAVGQLWERTETTLQTWSVTHQPAAKPMIALRQFTTIPEGRTHRIGGDRHIDTDSPRIRILATVTPQAGDSIADLQFARGQERFPISRQGAGFEVADLPLQPGEQTFDISAETTAGAVSDATLVVNYVPPLPSLTLLQPQGPLELRLGPDQTQTTVLLQGQVESVNEHPYQAHVLVYGDETEQARRIPLTIRGNEFKSDIELSSRNHRIQIELNSKWAKKEVLRAPISISLSRPPSIVAFQPPQPENEPFVDLRFQVLSPSPLSRVTVNEKALEAIPADRNGVYDFLLNRQPLLPGRVNVLRLQAWNEDGPSETASLQIRAPSAVPADIILSATDKTVPDPSYALRAGVRSYSSIESISISLNHVPVHTVARAVLEELPRNDHGAFVYEVENTLPLEEGPNEMTITVVNAGGAGTGTAIVTFVPPAVRATILELTNEEQRWPCPDQSPFVVDHVSSPIATLRGYVEWPHGTEQGLTDPGLTIHVRVNGYQFPAILDVAQGRRRNFAVPVLFDQHSNRVAFSLPGQPIQPCTGLIHCTRPHKEQKLHLLMIGVGHKHEDEIRGRVFRALKARENGGLAHSPAFREIDYEVICDEPHNVFYRDVQTWLLKRAQNIKDTVHSESRQGRRRNHVVIIYYEDVGQDHDRFRFETTHSAAQTSNSLAIEGVGRIFRDTLGAHLLFLDSTSLAKVERLTQGELGLFWMLGQASQPRLSDGLEEAIANNDFGVLGAVDRDLKQWSERLVEREFDSDLPSDLQQVMIGMQR